MALEAIYQPNDAEEINTPNTEIVSWIMAHVKQWEDHRDNNYETKWNEYYRMWRGVWKRSDQERDTERSKLIHPATQQAIEVQSAEIEEAIFGKGKWFDIADDVRDLEKEDMMVFRNALLEDLNEAGYPRSIAETILNGCIYGTGIAKIAVEEVDEYEVAVEQGPVASLGSEINTRIQCKLYPVEPREFAIDSTARTIDEALGCAHSLLVPRHSVVQKIQEGIYRPVTLGSYTNDFDFEEKGEIRSGMESEVKITEYHGLIPRRMLDQLDMEPDDIADMLDKLIDDPDSSDYLNDEDLIEAIVTIGNETELLKAVENPYTMKDRCFISYQHDTVPNRFWGRGVAEKGYHSQKALDAELRGRIDAMALSIHPMMGIDATRVPRGGDFSVRPGKNVLTNGDPKQVLMPFNFGQVNQNTFAQSGELERMIQMATGAMDSATPVSMSPRNSTASGMSMIQAGAIKRSKRTLSNIENTFIKPLIKKTAWRLMQFDPERYPPNDPKFVVNSTLGIMARELEMNQLTNLLSTTQGNTVGYWMLMQSIYEHSSVSNREQMKQVAGSMLQQAMNPQPDPMVQAKQQELQYKQQYDQAKLSIEGSRAQTEARRVGLEEAKTKVIIEKTQAELEYTQTKAESERRSTIAETEKTLKDMKFKEEELQIKKDELKLKKRAQDIDVELEKNKILLERDQMEMELRQKDAENGTIKEVKPPEVHIHGSSKKKITVKRTKDGLEGTSEEVK